ncbi:MAG: CPBP family intramembrane metalloprotease [Ruminococcus sp.]|nr:CPBP family intramembrane metalloprotease [Ruminococcus sp.]
MEDNKLINKQIRRISNTTALPLLIYIALYLLSACNFSDWIIKPLERAGVVVSDRGEGFLKYAVIYLIILPLGILTLRLFQGKNTGVRLNSCFRKPEKNFSWCLKWILISIGASAMLASVPTLISILIQSLLSTSASPTDGMFLVQSMSLFTVPKWINALVPTLLFAPVIEELIFRGLIFPNNRKLGEVFAIIVSGVFFGLWHQNLPQIFATASFGMFSAFLYLRTKSIYPSMIAHCINNAIAVFRDYLASNIDLENFSANSLSSILEILLPIGIYLLYCFFAGGIIVVGVVFFIIEVVKKREFHFEKGELDIPLKKKILVYITSPLTLILITYLITITILNTILGYYWFV